MEDIQQKESEVIKSEKDISIFRLVVQRIERRTILAVLAMLSFIVVIAILIVHDIPKDNTNLLYTLLGVLAMLVKDAFSYDFGSTTSSTNKDETIKQAALSALPPPGIKE